MPRGKKAELSSPQISSSDASLSLNLTGHKYLLLYWSLSPTSSSLSHPLRFCLPIVCKLFIHILQNYIGTKPKYALVKINSLSEEYKQCKTSKYTSPKWKSNRTISFRDVLTIENITVVFQFINPLSHLQMLVYICHAFSVMSNQISVMPKYWPYELQVKAQLFRSVAFNVFKSCAGYICSFLFLSSLHKD